MKKCLSSNEVEFLKNNWQVKPISFLADKLKLEPTEVTSFLRIYKINSEVHAVDHVFIGENLRTRKLTAPEVMEKLSLTKSQFQQIVNKKHQNRITENVTLVDADVATNTVRYFIESKLNLDIDYDSFVNLMPLCANHHKEFQKYELVPDEFLKDKKLMVEHLIKKSPFRILQ